MTALSLLRIRNHLPLTLGIRAAAGYVERKKLMVTRLTISKCGCIIVLVMQVLIQNCAQSDEPKKLNETPENKRQDSFLQSSPAEQVMNNIIEGISLRHKVPKDSTSEGVESSQKESKCMYKKENQEDSTSCLPSLIAIN